MTLCAGIVTPVSSFIKPVELHPVTATTKHFSYIDNGILTDVIEEIPRSVGTVIGLRTGYRRAE